MAHQWTDILFDLDGTLTDSGPGIANSARYALRRFGIEETDEAKLHRFVGPPLVQSFSGEYGFDAAKTMLAVQAYREYYADRGIFENTVYPGISQLLQSLQNAGRRLYLATSKPMPFAKRILAHFKLEGYFIGIGAPEIDETASPKAETIARLLAAEGIDRTCAVMVGDRKYDMIGAAANRLPGVGVLYGYGGEAELRAAGAAYIARDVEELGVLLL